MDIWHLVFSFVIFQQCLWKMYAHWLFTCTHTVRSVRHGCVRWLYQGHMSLTLSSISSGHRFTPEFSQLILLSRRITAVASCPLELAVSVADCAHKDWWLECGPTSGPASACPCRGSSAEIIWQFQLLVNSNIFEHFHRQRPKLI
jgi:hypothetical protein